MWFSYLGTLAIRSVSIKSIFGKIYILEDKYKKGELRDFVDAEIYLQSYNWGCIFFLAKCYQP